MCAREQNLCNEGSVQGGRIECKVILKKEGSVGVTFSVAGGLTSGDTDGSVRGNNRQQSVVNCVGIFFCTNNVQSIHFPYSVLCGVFQPQKSSAPGHLLLLLYRGRVT